MSAALLRSASDSIGTPSPLSRPILQGGGPESNSALPPLRTTEAFATIAIIISLTRGGSHDTLGDTRHRIAVCRNRLGSHHQHRIGTGRLDHLVRRQEPRPMAG